MNIRCFWLAALALCACAPTSEDEGASAAFVLSTFAEPSFTITVVDGDGVPLSGVSVSIEDVWLEIDHESTRGHSVYLNGVTNSSGVFSGTARLPDRVSAVDVIVHDDAGRTGPWTEVAVRDSLGYFAPSSRQTVAVAETIELTVALEDS